MLTSLVIAPQIRPRATDFLTLREFFRGTSRMLEFRTQNPLALLILEVSACALFVPPSVRSSGK